MFKTLRARMALETRGYETLWEGPGRWGIYNDDGIVSVGYLTGGFFRRFSVDTHDPSVKLIARGY